MLAGLGILKTSANTFFILKRSQISTFLILKERSIRSETQNDTSKGILSGFDICVYVSKLSSLSKIRSSFMNYEIYLNVCIFILFIFCYFWWIRFCARRLCAIIRSKMKKLIKYTLRVWQHVYTDTHCTLHSVFAYLLTFLNMNSM